MSALSEMFRLLVAPGVGAATPAVIELVAPGRFPGNPGGLRVVEAVGFGTLAGLGAARVAQPLQINVPFLRQAVPSAVGGMVSGQLLGGTAGMALGGLAGGSVGLLVDVVTKRVLGL